MSFHKIRESFSVSYFIIYKGAKKNYLMTSIYGHLSLQTPYPELNELENNFFNQVHLAIKFPYHVTLFHHFSLFCSNMQ